MEDITGQGFGNENFSNQQFSLNLSFDDLRKLVGWATFKAVMDIIAGALACLGIITAAYGVPLIIAGTKLLSVVDELKRYMSTNDVQKIASTLVNLQRFFRLTGIATIIKIIFAVLGIIIYIALIAYMVSNPDFMNNFINGVDFNY